MEAIISYHPAYHTDTAKIAAGPPRAKCKAINDPAISKYPHCPVVACVSHFSGYGKQRNLLIFEWGRVATKWKYPNPNVQQFTYKYMGFLPVATHMYMQPKDRHPYIDL